jgi:hypothetical protein
MADTLIFGCSWIPDRQRLWLTRQWCELVTRLNPDADIVAVHTPSEIDFPAHSRVKMFAFTNNVGHLDQPDQQGQDGWGRAFTTGLSIAAADRYQQVVHIECDVLLRQPVARVFRTFGTRAAAPLARPHQIPESALMFFRNTTPEWLQSLIRAYDWPSLQPSRRQPTPELPEQRLQRILGTELTILGLSGARCEGASQMTLEQAARVDWLTHASRAQYEAFLGSMKLC